MRPKVGQQWRHDPLICSPITSSSSCCDYWDNQTINQSMHLDRPLEWGYEAKTSEHLTLHIAGALVSALDAIYIDRLTWCRQALTVTDHVERRLQKFRVSPSIMKIMAMPSFPTIMSSGSCHRGLGHPCTFACCTAHQSAPGAPASDIQSAWKGRKIITCILFSLCRTLDRIVYWTVDLPSARNTIASSSLAPSPPWSSRCWSCRRSSACTQCDWSLSSGTARCSAREGRLFQPSQTPDSSSLLISTWCCGWQSAARWRY